MGRARAAVGIALAVVFVLPLLFMALVSLRSPGLPPPDGFELTPADPSLGSYRSAFLLVPLWRQVGNSLIVAAVAVPVTVLFASWGGFAIVTASSRWRKILLAATVGAMLVPVSALWVPRFVMLKWAGLTDTLWSLMTPALMATSPFYVLVFALAYHHVPRHLYDAARLDGWSPFQIWRRVAVPLTRPATFAVAVLAFVAHWSNFVDPLLYIQSPENGTLPLGLRALQTLEPQNFPILLAASTVAVVPSVVAFLAAQRAFFRRTLEAA